jgi:hypothetical protein
MPLRNAGAILTAWAALVAWPGAAAAIEEYADEIPNAAAFPSGEGNGCPLCHGLSGSFADDFAAENFTWTPALAAQDSDGDGYSNGWELQDPTGAWTPAQPDPGNAALATDTSQASDVPAPPFAIEPASLSHAEAAGTNGSEPLTIRNVGGVPFDWTLTPDVAWLAPDPGSATGLDPAFEDLVTVQFLTGGFADGAYMGNLQLAIAGIAPSEIPPVQVALTVPEPGLAAGAAAAAALGALARRRGAA